MARPRLPTSILNIRGSFDKHPERKRENEPENTNEVGNPPTHLNKLEKAAFREIVKLSIEGVLGEADRLAVEMSACLLVKCRGQYELDGEIILASAAEQNQFFKYLSQFGMCPADRSKIQVPPPKNKELDGWDEL